MNCSKAKNDEAGDMKERAKGVQLLTAAPFAPGEQSLFHPASADIGEKTNGMGTTSKGREKGDGKERAEGVERAPPFAPAGQHHSRFKVTATAIGDKLARQAIEISEDNGGRPNSSDTSSSSNDDWESNPDPMEDVARLAPNDGVEEQQLMALGSNSDAVDDTNAQQQTILVEADLAPELMAAEEVNIQEMINKTIRYRRILGYAMVFYGIAIICNIITFVFLFVNPPVTQGWVWVVFGYPLLTVPACCLLVLATMIMFLPTTRSCTPSIRLEDYAPDDKRLLRDAQIASVASLSITCGAIPILLLLPKLQWLGYALMTCALAGTVFALMRVRLLQRAKEARKEKSKAFWAVFVVFFFGLCGAAVWRCLNPIYPDCVGVDPYFLGNGVCNGGAYNTEECGYDGGDCLNEQTYPNCHVDNTNKIGDGYCDGGPYMTVECAYDGGDCVEFMAKYPGCIVDQPHRIGDGYCDLCGDIELYASPRVLPGNCTGCVQFPLSCSSGAYNTKACGYDGGDCDAVNEWFPSLYPDCLVENLSRIGDGFCDGPLYGTAECGFDGGDCLEAGKPCHGHLECASESCNDVTKVCDSAFVSQQYPDCRVPMPQWIGDGNCDGGFYASEACGFDGGDCLQLGEPCLQDDECASGFCNNSTKVCYLGILQDYPDCVVEYPRKIGDGTCNFGEYLTEACGYDGGDCLN